MKSDKSGNEDSDTIIYKVSNYRNEHFSFFESSSDTSNFDFQ